MLKRAIAYVFSALLICGGIGVSNSFANGYRNYIIATGKKGGIYYTVGVAISTLINIKLAKDGIVTTVITSTGDKENVRLLKDKKADFAILSGLYASVAYRGGDFKDKSRGVFYAVAALWPSVEHFLLLRRYVRTGYILDLKGLRKRFLVGSRGSETYLSTKAIFNALGIKIWRDLYPVYSTCNKSMKKLVSGEVVGAGAIGYPPVASVKELFSKLGAKRIVVLNFSSREVRKLESKYDAWYRYVLKPGTYAGQSVPVYTVAQSNFLVARRGLPQKDIYAIVKTIYKNLQFLHSICKSINFIKLRNALKGLSVPLAPGAIKFYRENDLTYYLK